MPLDCGVLFVLSRILNYFVVDQVVPTNAQYPLAVPSKRLADLIEAEPDLIGLVLELEFG